MIIPTTLWNNSSHMPSALQTFSKSSLGKTLKGGHGKPMIQTQKEVQRVEVTHVVTERELDSLISNYYLPYIPDCYLFHRKYKQTSMFQWKGR